MASPSSLKGLIIKFLLYTNGDTYFGLIEVSLQNRYKFGGLSVMNVPFIFVIVTL